MPVRPPPDPFEAQVEELPAGSVLHRVYGNQRRAAEFNPGFGEPTRFAFGIPKSRSSTLLLILKRLSARVPFTVCLAAGGVLFPVPL